MRTDEIEKFPPELLTRIRETGNTAILAGCSADEVIALCRKTVIEWQREKDKQPRSQAR